MHNLGGKTTSRSGAPREADSSTYALPEQRAVPPERLANRRSAKATKRTTRRRREAVPCVVTASQRPAETIVAVVTAVGVDHVAPGDGRRAAHVEPVRRIVRVGDDAGSLRDVLRGPRSPQGRGRRALGAETADRSFRTCSSSGRRGRCPSRSGWSTCTRNRSSGRCFDRCRSGLSSARRR